MRCYLCDRRLFLFKKIKVDKVDYFPVFYCQKCYLNIKRKMPSIFKDFGLESLYSDFSLDERLYIFYRFELSIYDGDCIERYFRQKLFFLAHFLSYFQAEKNYEISKKIIDFVIRNNYLDNEVSNKCKLGLLSQMFEFYYRPKSKKYNDFKNSLKYANLIKNLVLGELKEYFKEDLSDITLLTKNDLRIINSQRVYHKVNCKI